MAGCVACLSILQELSACFEQGCPAGMTPCRPVWRQPHLMDLHQVIL